MATPSLHPLLCYLRRLSGGMAGDVEDAQLLRRFLTQHDESAFTAIVQRYGAMVWALCVRRLGETPEAEDAFQATFLVLVRKARSLRGAEPLGPWLYGVAYRTAMKVRGQRTRRAARETVLPKQAAEERPEQVWSDLRPVLDEEVNRLPTKYRQPVLLCYLQGLSSEEAARRLGCAKGTIFSRLSRARDLLRRRLMKRGVGVSSGVLAAVLTDNAVRSAPPVLLCASTIRTSLLFAGGTASPALSAPLAALVEGVLRSMFLSKVKFAVIIFLALGLVGSGAGFIAHRTEAEQPASQQTSKSGTAAPAGVAEKTKTKKAIEAKTKKADESKPYVPPAKAGASIPYMPPPVVVDEKQRLREWRDKLIQPVRIAGFDDPETTLEEALQALSNHFEIAFVINERAFQFEEFRSPTEPNYEYIRKAKIASPAIPAMTASLRTVLRTILDRVNTGTVGIENIPTEVVFLVRKDHIEITTDTFLRRELGFRNQRPVLPLVVDAFEEMYLAQVLPRIAESSGYSVIADPHAKEQLQTKITAQLSNVPVDTALKLLADMADLRVARLDNVFYVTTMEKAKRLSEEQAKINHDDFSSMGGALPAKPESGKPAK